MQAGSKDAVTITLLDSTVMKGFRSPTTRLWNLQLPTPVAPLSGSALAAQHSATPAELVAFAHASLFSPALSTLSTALTNGYVKDFPGLTAKLLRKHPPRSVAMVKGHLDQSRKNLRWTGRDNSLPVSGTKSVAPDSDLDSSHRVKIPAFAPIIVSPP